MEFGLEQVDTGAPQGSVLRLCMWVVFIDLVFIKFLASGICKAIA